MPEYTVVSTITAITTQLSTSMPGIAIIIHRPTMVLAVLTFPLQPAAMTVPFCTATRRRPVTANYRVSTIIRAQAGNTPHSQYMAIAVITSSLSASGSRNLPKSVV